MWVLAWLCVGLALGAIDAPRWVPWLIVPACLVLQGLHQGWLGDGARSCVRRWTEPRDEWILSLDGEDLAVLSDGRFEDMFWSWYRLTPKHAAHRPKLMDAALWRQCRFAYRHRISGREVSSFMSGGHERPEEADGELRVLMRWFS